MSLSTDILNWPNDPKLANFVFLDVETTGGKHQRDFVTEIGLVHIHQGQWVKTWHSLIKPPVCIPPWITRITGISNALVQDAPTFAEVADELIELLQDKILVAHNARFDYGFLKSEFKRCEIEYRATTLCTVKLSRALFSQHERHSLDHIIERFNLTCSERHRALDDAQVLWDFFQCIPQHVTPETLWQQIKEQLKQPSLPSNLDPADLEGCEDVPGVYRFYNQLGHVIYIGKSVQLRSRILSHFNNDHRHSKELQISSEIHALDWTECAGDFSAQLLEAQEIKKYSPKHNVRLKKVTKLWSFTKHSDAKGYDTLKLQSSEGLNAEGLSQLYGLFRSQKQALAALEKLVNQHQLCHRLSGLEKKKSGACFAHQLKKCKGACCDKETAVIYNLRQDMALTPLKQKAWPWPGAILVYEQTPNMKQVHLINHWCWLGSADSEETLYELMENTNIEYYIDLDQYHLLCKFLLLPPKNIQINLLQ